MAWTAPRTWVAGNALTAAQLNVDIRDNENALSTHTHTGAAGDGALALSNHQVVRKAAAESNTATTVVSDAALLFTATSTGQIWAVDVSLTVHNDSTNNAPKFLVRWSLPASGIVAARAHWGPAATDGLSSGYTGYTNTTGPIAFPFRSVSGDELLTMHALLSAGASGAFQFQWNRDVAAATGTMTVASNSYLIAHRIA